MNHSVLKRVLEEALEFVHDMERFRAEDGETPFRTIDFYRMEDLARDLRGAIDRVDRAIAALSR